MSASIPYSVAIEEEAIVVRFDRDFFGQDELAELLDYLRTRVLRSHSHLSDDQIAELADQVNLSGWERIRDGFLDFGEQ